MTTPLEETVPAPVPPPASVPAPPPVPPPAPPSPPLPARPPAPPRVSVSPATLALKVAPQVPKDSSPAPPQVEVSWRLCGALLLFVPLADFCIYDTNAVGVGMAGLLLVVAGLAAFVSRGAGRVVWGAAILVPSLAATVFQGGSWPNIAAIFAGMSLLAWTNRSTRISWGIVLAVRRALTAGFRLPRYLKAAIGGVLDSVGELFQNEGTSVKIQSFGKRIILVLRLILPALGVSALFLFLLSLGNAVLAQKLQDVTETFGQWTVEIKWPKIEWPEGSRMLFWFVSILGGAILFIPALQSRRKEAEEHHFEERRSDGSEARRAEFSWLLGLVGVNLVFLLTNTLDAVYLWMRRTPPVGTNTTEYLHEGVYTLIFVTLLAGGLLAFLFNGGPALRLSKRLRWFASVWIFQNVFLMAGVALRLWLHIESAYLTPRRFGVGLFLLLVLTGFILLTIYIFKGKSLRWLIGRNLAAVLSLFFVVQFLDIETLCVNDALARRRKDTSLRISGEFLRRVGTPGWRLVHHIVQVEPKSGVPLAGNTADNARIHEVWKRLNDRLKNKNHSQQWQSYSWRNNHEAAELCKALGLPEVPPWYAERIWLSIIREIYGHG